MPNNQFDRYPDNPLMIVLARASRGMPLKRIVCGSAKRLIYVANPQRMDDVRSGESDPVGFPAEDVFLFDHALYERLCLRWERDGRTDAEDWLGAVPFRP